MSGLNLLLPSIHAIFRFTAFFVVAVFVFAAAVLAAFNSAL
jgi:hypothetical protein